MREPEAIGLIVVVGAGGEPPELALGNASPLGLAVVRSLGLKAPSNTKRRRLGERLVRRLTDLRPLDEHLKAELGADLNDLETLFNADVMAVFSPIINGLDSRVRSALDKLDDHRENLVIVLSTVGGVAEVVERMVTTVRHRYECVTVVVPDRAMSAGTILALSADRIMMDYYSCLGPIDPQIVRDDTLVPALSYLNQFERLNKKAAAGNLTTAEYALLQKLDLGDLYQFEQARELSIELLRKWLSQYKFRSWDFTETHEFPVTQEMREKRAKEIADQLNDTDRWHTHGRGIGMDTLRSELKLVIDDLNEDPKLAAKVREYYELLTDYMARENMHMFVHTRGFF